MCGEIDSCILQMKIQIHATFIKDDLAIFIKILPFVKLFYVNYILIKVIPFDQAIILRIYAIDIYSYI